MWPGPRPTSLFTRYRYLLLLLTTLLVVSQRGLIDVALCDGSFSDCLDTVLTVVLGPNGRQWRTENPLHWRPGRQTRERVWNLNKYVQNWRQRWLSCNQNCSDTWGFSPKAPSGVPVLHHWGLVPRPLIRPFSKSWIRHWQTSHHTPSVIIQSVHRPLHANGGVSRGRPFENS